MNNIKSDFNKLKEDKLVQIKQQCQNGNELNVVKYHRRVFFKNLWNKSPLLKMARGLIVDDKWNIIALPFVKVFNFNEGNTGRYLKRNPTTLVETVYKANGYMLAVSLYDDKLLFSSTGSLESEHVIKGSEMISENDKSLLRSLLKHQFKDCTISLEICHRDEIHPIIEDHIVYFLSVRKNIWDVNYFGMTPQESNDVYDRFFANSNFRKCEYKKVKFNDLLVDLKDIRTEGVMVYCSENNETFKIKSRYYLTTKFFMRLGNKRLDNLYKDPEQFKKTLKDEEFFWIVDLIFNNKDFINYTNEDKRQFIVDNYNHYLDM